MKRLTAPFAVVLLAAVVATLGQAAPTTRQTSRTPTAADRLAVATSGPAAGKRMDGLEPYALITGPMPAGVAVSHTGRIFLTFPQWGAAVESPVCEVMPDRSLRPLS